jgi:hypothetical protein
MTMPEQEKEFLKVLKLLSDNDALGHVIVIGSWAEYLYQNTGLIPSGTTALRTLDIDFLVKNMRLPHPPINFERVAREAGYAVENHFMFGTTRIITASRLEIEFLIDQKGAGAEPVYETAIGVTAQALRGLNLLLRHTAEVEYLGIKVTVPIPEVYVIHKIIINAGRNKDYKREKDKNNIFALLPHIDMTIYNSILEETTKKQRREIDAFYKANPEFVPT